MDNNEISKHFVNMSISKNDHGSDEPQDHSSSAGCNLIVNYLPHDIDDLSLRVSIIGNLFM